MCQDGQDWAPRSRHSQEHENDQVRTKSTLCACFFHTSTRYPGSDLLRAPTLQARLAATSCNEGLAHEMVTEVLALFAALSEMHSIVVIAAQLSTAFNDVKSHAGCKAQCLST